jgi:3,4-dihydroxy 2-butanone 4-phosphate synthase/GTP cyclohydrolase II
VNTRLEAALQALREGKPVLVADNEDRENEVDAIMSAQTTTEAWIAWTIRHSSGYLCAPLPAARADALDLPLMVPRSEDPRRTAYTVTVDAAKGITTGISAHDRLMTLKVLADPSSGPRDVIRPGHILPLRAAQGGVLHRAGHTEAAVDLCRLAGLRPVAAICELVHDDGSMMRLPEACELAAEEGLVVLTIAELAAWRAEHDPAVAEPEAPVARVHRVQTATMPTDFGHFTVYGYRDLRTGAEHVALVAERPANATTDPHPAVRVHSECLTGEAFGSMRCDCGPQLHAAMERVAAEGGAVIYMRGHEGRGIGLLPKIHAYALQDQGRDTVEANLDLGWPADRREYGAAAAILIDLGMSEIRLLTTNPAKEAGLVTNGITVVGRERIQVGLSRHNLAYMRTKKNSMGHDLSDLPPDIPVADLPVPTDPAGDARTAPRPAKEN